MKEINRNALLRSLPKVDVIISSLLDDPHFQEVPLKIIKTVIQKKIEEERVRILSNAPDVAEKTTEEWLELFKAGIAIKNSPKLKRVVNCTGVVVHTNLGRSVLSPSATRQLSMAAEHYTNLEFNLDTGKRGSRYTLVEELICELTGAEAALVVNNNAAAVLIALDTLAKGKEAIVSRGQLVEIGGSFRIPDVMAKSGATLVEVGATNRTHLFDYERAITENTALLLRVHTSNFRIIGFTSEVSAGEMVTLARKHRLVTMEDLGSGSLIDFSPYGFPKEPTVQEIVSSGVDIITFSGDKLLGGPQAGIIVGKKDIIDRVKKNPLNRALRIDKFTLASLEAILKEYYDPTRALTRVPTLAMLTVSSDELKKRAQKIMRKLQRSGVQNASFKIVSTTSKVGGGALPDLSLPSWAVQVAPVNMTINKLENTLRGLSVPIIGRVESESYILDVRTIQNCDIDTLVELLCTVFSK